MEDGRFSQSVLRKGRSADGSSIGGVDISLADSAYTPGSITKANGQSSPLFLPPAQRYIEFHISLMARSPKTLTNTMLGIACNHFVHPPLLFTNFLPGKVMSP